VLVAPLQQCEDRVTSLDFITQIPEGLLFFNGPVEDVEQSMATDFISLELVDGYPRLRVDQGTGELELVIDGRDLHDHVVMQRRNDGRWHHIDIVRKGQVCFMD
jgi:hypothetical protein